MLIWRLDLLLARPHQAAISSMLGALHLGRTTYTPPLAAFIGALVHALSPLGATAADAKNAITAVVNSCEALRVFVGDAAAQVAAMAQSARAIKPLRALLDLSETDAWAADGIRSKIRSASAWWS